MDFFSENFNIYLKNLSVVYVSSMTALVCAAVAIIYFVISNNLKDRKSTQNKPDKNSDSEAEASNHESDDDDLTPRKNLIGRLKTAKLKLLEESMTEEQKQAEKEIERQQLAAIFKLLKEQEQQHCEPIALDEGELQAQLNLYR